MGWFTKEPEKPKTAEVELDMDTGQIPWDIKEVVEDKVVGMGASEEVKAQMVQDYRSRFVNIYNRMRAETPAKGASTTVHYAMQELRGSTPKRPR